MTPEKKKNFGLAAQLAQPRPIATVEATPAASPRDPEEPATEPSITPTVVDLDTDTTDAEGPPLSERSDHTDHTKRRSAKQKKPGAPPREGGYIRRTVTLAPAISDYVDRAWRTYRTPSGKYVKGVSGFIEAVIDEHRRRPK
jgi:hypothetical protein